MEEIFEVTQTWCECLAKDCRDISYKIKAQVVFEEGVGSKLNISIQPPLNNLSADVLDFDNSRLPAKMACDWFCEHIKEISYLQSFEVINSNEAEHKIEIIKHKE